jgi:hypothetical protein
VYPETNSGMVRWWLRVTLAIMGSAPIVSAQSVATRGSTNPIGVWRGTSKCLVQPSACHDEIVVYRITQAARDSVSMDARKIVDAREEGMGVLACALGAHGASLTCTMRNGVWRFSIRGDSLVGELRLPDSTRFRDVRASRSR